MNQHSCDMGTPRQEVKIASSGLPDIKILDTYCKGLSEEALRAENCAGAVTNTHATCNRDDEKISSRTERKL